MERIRQALEKAKRHQLERDADAAADAGERVIHASDVSDVNNPPSPESATQFLEKSRQHLDSDSGWRSNAGTVPLDFEALASRRVVALDRKNPVSATYDLLRTKVLQSMKAHDWRVLGITSPGVGEGKTVTAINLALSIAKLSHQTVLLMDFDFRNPGLLQTLGHTPARTLDDWLTRDCEFSDTLFATQVERLTVTGVATPFPSPAEALASNRVAALLAEVRERYSDRIIILDMPPVLDSDDALSLLPRVDCILLVTAAGQTTQSEVQDCLSHLPKHRLVGTVLNKAIH